MINIDDFLKLELKVGKIVAVEKVLDTDKLLKLEVDLGEEQKRTIVSGIALFFPEYEKLVGTKCIFVANLEPRVIKGIESQGMILTVSGTSLSLLTVPQDIPEGTRVK